MSDYKESNIAGTSWQRCNEVQIFNTRGAVPKVKFYEEQIIVLEGSGEIRQAVGSIEVGFDPAKVVPILNPETGDGTGQTITYAEAYAILYSAYLAAAKERDAQIHVPVDPIGE